MSSFLLGCGGQGSGNAPSAIVVPRPPGSGIGSEGIFKYGQTASTTNGWTITFDHTDPVETVNLANGWTVEVLHE